YALQKAAELFMQHDVIVMAGGTGLYIKAFCEGMDEVPEVAAELREKIIKEYESNGLDWLQEQVKQNDPGYFANGEIQNPQWVMRAVEVKLSSVHTILSLPDR